MRRLIGLLPVLLLSVGTVVSAVIGLSLAHETQRSIAHELGCHQVRTSQLQPGVDKQTCIYHGDTLIILTLSEGPHTLYPPDVTNDSVIGVRAGHDVWVVNCQRRTDCVQIQRKLGGRLTTGPLLGVSVTG